MVLKPSISFVYSIIFFFLLTFTIALGGTNNWNYTFPIKNGVFISFFIASIMALVGLFSYQKIEINSESLCISHLFSVNKMIIALNNIKYVEIGEGRTLGITFHLIDSRRKITILMSSSINYKLFIEFLKERYKVEYI